MSHSVPACPNGAVASRMGTGLVRPVVWAVAAPTWLPVSSGG